MAQWDIKEPMKLRIIIISGEINHQKVKNQIFMEHFSIILEYLIYD
ncbi:hypothetical protein pb186bvf_012285 [Paramecium bursaria]